MLNLDAGLVKKIQGPVSPLYRVNFTMTLAAGGTRDVEIIKARAPMENASGVWVPNIVSHVSPAASSLDPLTRQSVISQLSIAVSDPGPGSYIRQICELGHLKGRLITVVWGVDSATLWPGAPYWSGAIDDAVPSPGIMTFRCSSVMKQALEQDRAGLWAGKHPYELQLDILKWIGIPEAQIDTASFAYNIDTSISHLVARRAAVTYDGGDVTSLVPYGAIIDARAKNWSLEGFCAENSNLGKVYPLVAVTPDTIHVQLYDHYDSSRKLVAVGYRKSYNFAAGFYRIYLAANWIDNENPPENSVTGVVDVEYTGGTYTIALASTSYFLGKSAVLGSEIKAHEALSALGRLTMSSVVERETGIFECLRFDPSRAAVAHWTQDTLRGPISISGIAKNLINEVRIDTTFMIPGRTEWKKINREIRIIRADSQSNHSIDGGTTPGSFVYKFKNDWSNAISALQAAIDDSETSFIISQSDDSAIPIRNYGQCGTGGVDINTGVQPPQREADITDGREIFLLLIDSEETQREIIKVRASEITGMGSKVLVDDPQYGEISAYQLFEMGCTNCVRAQLNTSPYAWAKNTLVHDITAQVLLGQSILDRLEEGAPVWGGVTGLSESAVQVGDFITADDTLLCGTGFDGVSDTTKWEVLKKEPDHMAGEIRWTLCRVAPAGSPTASTVTTPLIRGEMRARQQWQNRGTGVASKLIDHEPSTRAAIARNPGFSHTTRDIRDRAPSAWNPPSGHGSWGAAGDIYEDATTKRSGVRSAHFRATAEADTRLEGDFEPVEEGRLFAGNVTMHGDSVNAGDKAVVQIDWADSSGAVLSSTTVADKQVSGSAWATEPTVHARAPANARFARIVVKKITT